MGKTWQVILATVAIFLAGLVTGGATALGVVWVVRHRAMNAGQGGAAAGQRQGAGAMQQFSPQLMRSFAKQPDLAPAQRARIMPIVGRPAGQRADERREAPLRAVHASKKMHAGIAE